MVCFLGLRFGTMYFTAFTLLILLASCGGVEAAHMKATLLLDDFNTISGQTKEFVEFQGKFFFLAQRNEAEHSETFVYDGQEVTSLYNSTLWSSPNYFFPISDEEMLVMEGRKIYTTDGTPNGTELLLEGASASKRYTTDGPAVFGGKVYFGSRCGNYGIGTELCRLDPSTGEIQLMADLLPGSDDSYPRLFRILSDDKMWFKAELLKIKDLGDPDVLYDHTMFVTDGTPNGTMELNPPTVQMYQNTIPLVMNGNLYFQGRSTNTSCSHLWKTDGTVEGTTEVFARPGRFSCSSLPNSFMYLPGTNQSKMAFIAASKQMYVLDGETMEAEWIWEPSHDTYGFEVKDHVEFNGKLFFTQSYRIYEGYLFSTDGTPNGTETLADVAPLGAVDLEYLTVAGDKLYFVSTHINDTSVHDLWQTDGTHPPVKVAIDWSENDGVDGLYGKLLLSVNSYQDKLIIRTQSNDYEFQGEIWALSVSDPPQEWNSTAIAPTEDDIMLEELGSIAPTVEGTLEGEVTDLTMSPTSLEGDNQQPEAYNGTSSCHWSLMGEAQGDSNGDRLGREVALSRDGTILAMAADQWWGVKEGYVKVVNTTTFQQLGSTLTTNSTDAGVQFSEMFGSAIALSGDGTILAVGAYDGRNPDYSNTGFVQVFEYHHQDKDWQLVGNTLYGSNSGDDFGEAVALSDDGSVLAVGAWVAGDGVQRGQIFVYQRTASNAWSPMGAPINGTRDYERLGVELALSSDGTKLVADNDVYEFRSSLQEWVALGSLADPDCGGYEVAMSEDGNTVAMHCLCDLDTVEYGTNCVKVYHLQANQEVWVQLGNNIYGLDSEFGDAFGEYGLALSATGDRIAIGANDGARPSDGLEVGYVLVFGYNCETETWERQGNSMQGEVDWYGSFGESVGLSGSGSVVAIGDSRLRDSDDETGLVQAFHYTCPQEVVLPMNCLDAPDPDEPAAISKSP